MPTHWRHDKIHLDESYQKGIHLSHLLQFLMLRLTRVCIIESVDSICTDSTDTQYMITQKNCLKILKNDKLNLTFISKSQKF